MREVILATVAASAFFAFVARSNSERAFLFVLFAVIAYAYYSRVMQSAIKKNTVQSFLDSVEKDLSGDLEIPLNNVFYVHKTPRSLKYLRRHRELCEVAYDLKFVRIYDRASFDKMISYIEYFLKVHYKIMLGYYEFRLFESTLRDIRIEILNTMKTFYFNLPTVSTIVNISDIDDYVEKRIRRVQAILYKFLKIAHRKYYSSEYKPPHDLDETKGDRYALF